MNDLARDFSNVHFHSSPWSLMWQSRWIFQKGRELISQHHHDVMTVHEYPPFYNGIGASKLHKVTKIPYALEIHHIVGYPVARSCAEWIGKILSRLYLAYDAKHAKAVRVVNQSVKKTLSDWGIPQEKISVVPSFYLDAEALKPDPAIAKNCDIVFCARLVANKGLKEVLDAVAMLPQRTLLVIGDGPLLRPMKQYAEQLGLKDRTGFVGFLSAQDTLTRAFQSGKVFVMNSTSEGGPRVALEAMALGVPVLSTRVGVMPDVMRDGENGMFTDGSAKDLAQKITLLLDDEELRERLGREAQNITKKFERKALIQNYADFLQSLAKQ